MLFFRKNFIKILTLILSALLFTGCSVFGVRSEEQPSYEVLVKQKNYEIRKYQPHIVAKTTVSGTFEQSQNKGFRILAGYIFGKNKSKEKIAMTAPVVQSSEIKNEKIAMTAPVLISPGSETTGDDASTWIMTFSMPAKYNLNSLPTPDDKRIILEQTEEKLVAVNIFSGFWGKLKNKKKADELLIWLEKIGNYEAISLPMFAGYNPPWTLPFLRRNEMQIELKALSN